MDGKFGKCYGLPNIFYAPILGMLINTAIAHRDVVIMIVFTQFVNKFALSKCHLLHHRCNSKPKQIWHDMAWPLVAFVETILIAFYLLPSTITSSKIKIVQDTTSHTCIHPHWTCFRQKFFKLSHWHICDQEYYCP
jgi:hypothetical protein